MINFDDVAKENIKEHNLDCTQIPGCLRIWKKSLFNLMGHPPDIDKIYLYAKDQYETK